MLNSIGAISTSGEGYPAPGYFALGKLNTALVPQLSSDSLLGPLMFDNSSSSSGGNNNSGATAGLTAGNQIQQAANFIRYATGAVAPLALPKRAEYSALFLQAIADPAKDKSVTQAMKIQAQNTIVNYLANLRIYTAQMSVGISNLYYILSQRMPQKSLLGTGAGGGDTQTSQALSEFTMATWRLQPPTPSESGKNDPIWFNQINQASSATVQKEIAILLAEINYQLYLNRVQQERLLLTNSMMLIHAGRTDAQQNLTLNGTAAVAAVSTNQTNSNP